MQRRRFILGLSAIGIAACSSDPSVKIGTSGAPRAKAYIIDPEQASAIQFRMVDSVNALRAASGMPPVELSAKLNAAAATHSRDMSLQNRPWLFGSDGSSPIDRAQRVGFTGRILGENISESYETELETLAAWMNQQNTRLVILDPKAKHMGFSWAQESTGKLWWTLTMGGAEASPLIADIVGVQG